MQTPACRAIGVLLIVYAAATLAQSGRTGAKGTVHTTDLSGEWICQRYCPAGGAGKTARILQEAKTLHFTNEGGMRSDGILQDDLKTVVAYQWENLNGTLSEDGKQLTWANGTVWTRSLSAVLHKIGRVDVYGIHFDVDKATIKPDSKTILDQIAQLLKDDPTLRLEVAGHTDNTGTAAHNQALSQRRADSVVEALVRTYKIDRARLEPKGYGDTKPVAPNTTAEGKAENRRVELKKL